MIEQFLAQQFGDNPQMQAMLSMMQQRQTIAIESTVAEAETIASAELQEQLKRAHSKITQLKKMVKPKNAKNVNKVYYKDIVVSRILVNFGMIQLTAHKLYSIPMVIKLFQHTSYHQF